MKVIHVPRRLVASEWGGTETTIMQLSRAMRAQGHDVQIFTTSAMSSCRQEVMHGVPVRRFPYTYPFFGLSPQDINDMDRKGGNLLSFSLFWALLREPGIDLLHAHSGKRLGGIVRTVARLRRIPYVISLHGGVFDVPAGEMQQMLNPIKNTLEWGKPFGALLGSRRVLTDAAAVLCVGENEYRAAARNLPGRRIEMMPNGVDGAHFASGDGRAFRKAHGIAETRKLILCLSRIDYQKNQIALVEALPSLLERVPEAHVVLIGPVTVAAYAQRLRETISRLGVAERVTLLPGLNPDDPMLVNAYHAADVFCLPSLHEPFGIVILEAWASGLPVAAARVGGIPSFTNDGEDVMLFDPESREQIASVLGQVLTTPGLSRRLAENGLVKAREQYDWSVISQHLMDIYATL